MVFLTVELKEKLPDMVDKPPSQADNTDTQDRKHLASLHSPFQGAL